MSPPEPPVFDEPWQAEAFALVVHLHDRGVFTWSDWAGVLSARIRVAEARGETVEGAGYHACWLAALEDLVTGRGLAPASALAARKDAWESAYRDTPHGQPVRLAI